MSIFFTSDTHYFHAKMAVHRGFGDTASMNDALIEAWNSKVARGDTVYHLGDLSFGGPEDTASVLLRLHGSIKLVPGNHDLHSNGKRLRQITELLHTAKLEVLERLYTLKAPVKAPLGAREQRIELCHFPLLVWDRGHYGAYHLHGHSHGHCKYPDVGTTRLDVGVDSVGFAPLSIDEVVTRMVALSFKAHDLHDPKRYEGRA